jgi:hypothetical protein
MGRERILGGNNFILIGLILLIATGVLAETTGKVEGKVTNAKTGEGLPGANLVLVGLSNNTNYRAATDLNGSYTIFDVPMGTYALQASMAGYLNSTKTNLQVVSGQTTRQDVKLGSNVPVTVRGKWDEDLCRGGCFHPRPPICVQMLMTPSPPHLGDTAEVFIGAKSQEADLTKAEVEFVYPNPKQRGVELVDSPAKYTTSFKLGVWKEFRYKIKFAGPAVSFQVVVRAIEFGPKKGSIETNLSRYYGIEGANLVLFEKDKKYYPPGMEPKEPKVDPYAELQKELSLPDSGYWYSVALHLRDDLVRYAQAKGISYEEAKKVLKDRAERMSREEKMEKSKTYETILTHRLLWKESKLPDPFAVPPAPQSKVLNLESDVKMVAHAVQLAVEDYKMTPGKEGIKPTSVLELRGALPKAISDKPNPFNFKQTYSPEGGALVDGHPRKPGQIGYIYKGQDQQYLIQGLGVNQRVIISLIEGN